MTGIVAVCALLAVSCSLASLAAMERWEPQWIYSVSITRSGHNERCQYVGSHNWMCR